MLKSYMHLTATAIAIALLTGVDAREEFVKRIPNGANVNGVVALGHKDGLGSSDSLNVFGNAFEKAGNKWTAALCQADSDGDGQTNGQELGDPCCVWTTGGTPQFTSGVSHPGDASKKVDASLLTSNSCSATTTTTAPAASAAATASHAAGAVVTVAAVLAQW